MSTRRYRSKGPLRVDISLLGDEALSRKLRSLDVKLERRFLSKALRAGGKPILQDAKRLVPKDTGALRKSLKLRKSKTRARFGVKPTAFRIFTGTKEQLGVDPRYGGYYPFAIEAGYTDSRTGRRVPPKSYLRASLRRNTQRSLRIIRVSLWRQIQAEARR